MAMDDNENIFDPYNGQNDLKNKILRHVSKHFVEDPLRVLRVARFNSYLEDFKIASETLDLMKKIVQSEELKTLSGERIFQETVKALQSKNPSLYFKILDDVGALKVLFPEVHRLKDVPQKEKYHPEGDCLTHTYLVLDSSVQFTQRPEIRFSCLVHDLGKGVTPKDVLPSHKGHESAGLPIIEEICERLKVPNKYRKLALKVCKNHLLAHKANELRPSTILKLFKDLDLFRTPELLEDFLICCISDNMGKLKNEYPQSDYLRVCWENIKDMDTSELKKRYKGKELGEQIDQHRIKIIKEIKTNFIWPT